MFALGIERLLSDSNLKAKLHGRRVALLGHPASVNQELEHSLDLLMREEDLKITAAFGPQHGMRGEKQDNMIESSDYHDPKYGIPVFSLYGDYRRPTPEMLESFDVILIDLQDVGCRIYTFLTTLFYVMDECATAGKSVWVLDRPNPAGRPVEGLILKNEYQSFVGAAAVPMRHGLTLGEAAYWYKAHKKLDVDLEVVSMNDYDPKDRGGMGWVPGVLSWVNPSPNLPRLSGVQMYAGTVMIEGTTLSEGRGTTIPLELIGAPDIDGEKVVEEMFRLCPDWLWACRLRPCFFEPTFQKHSHKLCSGLQIHIDQDIYEHNDFKPFRLVSLAFKSIRQIYPEYNIWRSPPYEYEKTLLPIDILSGSDELRRWVDQEDSTMDAWEQRLSVDEAKWAEERKPHLIYG